MTSSEHTQPIREFQDRGLISEIQRFSLHDGPGIRSTVFLKGCNLRCAWCHNPETLRPAAELQLFLENCIACGACVRACRAGAHVLVEEGRREFRRAQCQACGACARVCYAQALVLVGQEMSVDEVLAEVGQDRAFYQDSGGGVTISGGEPLCQAEFTQALLRQCHDAGLPTALETNLAYPWEMLAPLLPLLELLMVDVKTLDAEAHRQWTGADNARILQNLHRLGATSLPLIVRTPVIPAVNDNAEAIGHIADFLSTLPNLRFYELLPYHPLGAGKYPRLGMTYTLTEAQRPSDDCMHLLAAAARSHGIEVRAAGVKGDQ